MDISEHSWKGIYASGGLFTSLVIFLILLDMVGGIVTGSDLTAMPATARDRFIQLQDNPMLGLYNLDLLNLIIQVLMIPVFFALYASLRKNTRGEAFLSLVIFLVGVAVYLGSNPALPMFELSFKWLNTNNEILKNQYIAAGESILASGSHGSLGAFSGYALITIAGLLMSWSMASGRVFNRKTYTMGIAGNALLLLYLIAVTFIPPLGRYALLVALPGGLLTLAWMTLFGLRLFKLRLGRQPGKPAASITK